MGTAGKAELIAEAGIGLVGVPLDQVGHGVLGTPAVHDLLGRVVRVHDVGPRHVPEIFAPLQLLGRLTNLQCIVNVKKIILRNVKITRNI